MREHPIHFQFPSLDFSFPTFQRPTLVGRSDEPLGTGVLEMAHRKRTPARNSDRVGHGENKQGKAPQHHEDAMGHGGRTKPNFTPNPNQRRPTNFAIWSGKMIPV